MYASLMAILSKSTLATKKCVLKNQIQLVERVSAQGTTVKIQALVGKHVTGPAGAGDAFKRTLYESYGL